MEDKIVTIAEFPNYIEAEIAKQLLADYGIESIVAGENASNVYSIPAIETPRLQIFESQAQKAKEILKSRKNEEESDSDELNGE